MGPPGGYKTRAPVNRLTRACWQSAAVTSSVWLKVSISIPTRPSKTTWQMACILMAMKSNINMVLERGQNISFWMVAILCTYIGGKVKKIPRLVVEGEQEQMNLIRTIHDVAHLGRDKILSQLNERYYWPEMYKQVCDYVSLL